MLEFYSLIADVERPDLEPWQRRSMLNVLTDMKNRGYLSPHEAMRVEMVRERVLKTFNGHDGEAR